MYVLCVVCLISFEQVRWRICFVGCTNFMAIYFAVSSTGDISGYAFSSVIFEINSNKHASNVAAHRFRIDYFLIENISMLRFQFFELKMLENELVFCV